MLQLMLRQMPGFVCLLSGPDHRYDYVNDAYVEIAGQRDFVGRTVREVLPELAGQGYCELLDEVFASGERFAARAMPLRLEQADGGERFIDFLYEPIRDETGTVTGIFVGGYDVTEQVTLSRDATTREHELRTLTDALPVLVAYVDAGERYRFANRLYEEWFPGGRAEILGHTVREIVGERAYAAVEARIAAALAGHRVRFEQEMPYDRTDRRHIAVEYVPRFSAEGAVEGFYSLVQDVSAAKLAETALRESEERYRTLFGAIDVGFCIIEMKFDESGRAVDYRLAEINPAFECQTGLYGAAGRWVSEAVPGLERHWFDLYGGVARTGHPIRFENHAEPFGRWYDVHAFRCGDPQLNRVAILFNDITERRVAEDRLRALNETLETEVLARTAEIDRLWATSPDLMLVVDFDGRIRRVNPAWTTVLGFEPAELVGQPLSAFLLPEHHEETARAFTGAQGPSPKVENRHRHKNGSTRWIAWTAAPENGLTYATGRDVTVERERAAELELAQEALRQSQKMEAVGQLTGGMAHDFNNLLAGISGSLEMIQTRIAQGRVAEIDRYIQGAQGAAKRAAALTHRLLAFSRRQTLEPKPTDVNRLVREMEDLVRRTVGPEVAVEFVADERLWPTLVDPNQLENALLNLCINARDAMPEGGRITIETTNRALDARGARARDLPTGSYVAMSVSDTGTGMPADVLERAFDPFFTTKPIGVGTGLGLSMIYGFARQSGGQVRIASEPGKGTTVCLYLPRHHGEAVEEAEIVRGDVARGGAMRTVLVVDDEPLVRMLVVDAVEDLGFVAIEAADGPQAMKILQTDGVLDLMITDVGLPNGMTGRQLAEAARERRPGLKVLFVTGYAETSVLGTGQLDPGMQVVTKPFDIAMLSNRIQTLTAD